MNTPLNFDEMPSEEWKKLKQFVTASDAKKETPNMDEEFEESVVTKILVSSLAPVTAPDSFEDDVMRRIAAEAQPTANPTSGWERITSALRTRTAAVIGIVALISGGTLSIYTLNQENTTFTAPLKQNIETEIDLSPVPVQLDTRFEKQPASQEKSKGSTVKSDSSKLPIPGKKTPQPPTDEDLF